MKKTISKLSIISLILFGCAPKNEPEISNETQQNQLPPVTCALSQLILDEATGISFPAALDFEKYIAIMRSQENSSPLLQTFTGERDAQHFPLFIDYLKVLAARNGISSATISKGLSNVYFIERAVIADKNQPEKKFTLQDYLNRVLNKSRFQQAKSNLQHYKTELDGVAKQSGVPANVIVALWGLESSFGKIQGKEDVISAVATLAYEGRREPFFTKEVISALTILENGYITREKMKGSWAGAMGQCQFMPSSLLRFGADGDNDGIIDIWSNQRDVFASIANYLSTIGWDKSTRWGQKVTVPATFNSQLAGTADNLMKTVGEWKKLGVTFAANENQPPENKPAWLILPDDDLNSAHLVHENFRTLMHWNRSYYFGISVGILSDSLK